MRTFAQGSKAVQRAVPVRPRAAGHAHFEENRGLGSILHLQRTVGNHAVQRVLRAENEAPEGRSAAQGLPRFTPDFSRVPAHFKTPPRLQPKLKVGPVSDIYEQEAERVSREVMRSPGPALQRTCSCGGECPDCKSKKKGQEDGSLQLQRVPDSAASETVAPEIVQEVLSDSGRPLEPAARDFMEPRFGHDFGGVRIHDDPRAADSAESVGARAYTVGHHVVFGAGEYRPGTADGQRLLAHELAHVTQQGAAGPAAGPVVRRDDKEKKAPTPAPNTAAGGPKLDFRPAKNSPPCACIVFMHHNEPNARLMAQWMYELCRYNLAIVDPQTREREIDLPAKGKIDPNELFPRKVAEECWADDKPCEDFLSKNAGATKAGTVEEYAQRQFFLAIKKCSDGFSLPVVALHNNTIDETARYRKAVKDPKAPLDVKPIQGKTFDDSLKAGETSTEPNTLPFTDLQDWLLKNVPGVEKRKKPKGSKGKLEGGPIAPGKTNIFLWCSAEDISHCQIGDPERPDNVVWVTNNADFEKLRGTKTNVVLQSRVDPAGRSATDLSSLFVFLEGIVDAHFVNIISKLEAEIAVEASEISDALEILLKLKERGDLPEKAGDGIGTIMLRVIDLLLKLLKVEEVTGERAVKLSQLRFVNVETPQSPYDPKTKPEDLRVQSYRDVRATLGALGLDCCDAKAPEGEAESAVEKVEKALREGKAPKS